MFTSLQIKFLIFIAIFFIITAGFAILMSGQMKKVSKKALSVKLLPKGTAKRYDDE